MKRYVALNSEPTPVEALRVERRRLEHGIGDDERFLGMGPLDFYVLCEGNAAEVLARAKQVMRIVNAWGLAEEWPTDEQWPDLLPRWFVDACAPNKTKEETVREVAEYQAMGPEERLRRAQTRRWTLAHFTSWMAPTGRLDPEESHNWIWFDAEVLDSDRACVRVDTMLDTQGAWPPGLRWLFRACGAKDMDDILDIDHMIGVRPA